MLSASTDLPQVQSYHNQYFYSLDFALFINKKQNKGGESLPLARTTLLATPSSGAKFILTQPRNAPEFTPRANYTCIGIVSKTSRHKQGQTSIRNHIFILSFDKKFILFE